MNSLPLPKGKRSFDQSTAGKQTQYQFVKGLNGVDPNLGAVDPGLVYPAHKRRYVATTPNAASAAPASAQFSLALPTNFNFSNAPMAGPSMEATMNGNLTIDPLLTQCEPAHSAQNMRLNLNLPNREPVHSGQNTGANLNLSQREPAPSAQKKGDKSNQKKREPPRTNRVIGEYAFEEAGLAMPPDLEDADYEKIIGFIDWELARQEANPPVLPPSQLPEMVDKPLPEAPYEIPDDNPRLAKLLLEKNKIILQKSKRLDKERNNLAAKATRERRAEALENTRILLNQRDSELNWWKLRAITFGADPNEYANLRGEVKQSILSGIEQRLVEKDQENSEHHAKNKSQKQSNRTASSNKHVQKDKEAKAREVALLKAKFEAEDAAALQLASQQAQELAAMNEPFQQPFNQQQPSQVAAAA
ncbi:hypothetical protein ACHAPT_001573 [Fusarium lateritium]